MMENLYGNPAPPNSLDEFVALHALDGHLEDWRNIVQAADRIGCTCEDIMIRAFRLERKLRKAPIVILKSDPERRPGRILEKRGRKRAIVLFEGQPRPTEHAVENLEPFNLFTAGQSAKS